MATKKKSGSGTQKKQQQTQKKRQQRRTPLVKVGALWIKSGANGKYLAGSLDIDDDNSMRVMVFPNGYKEEAKHPDYVIYAPSSEENEEAPAKQQHLGLPGADTIGKSAEESDDDIPF